MNGPAISVEGTGISDLCPAEIRACPVTLNVDCGAANAARDLTVWTGPEQLDLRLRPRRLKRCFDAEFLSFKGIASRKRFDFTVISSRNCELPRMRPR